MNLIALAILIELRRASRRLRRRLLVLRAFVDVRQGA